MAPGTSSMLRARRRDVNVKPNRVLDRSSSRGMIYENEELRLRTININAEVERSQGDIKKLRRENETLKREIWQLREEYDRLEEILKEKQQLEDQDESEDEGDEEEEEEDEDENEEENDDEIEEKENADQENAQNQRKAGSIRKTFDNLSVVEEVPEESPENSIAATIPPSPMSTFGHGPAVTPTPYSNDPTIHANLNGPLPPPPPPPPLPSKPQPESFPNPAFRDVPQSRVPNPSLQPTGQQTSICQCCQAQFRIGPPFRPPVPPRLTPINPDLINRLQNRPKLDNSSKVPTVTIQNCDSTSFPTKVQLSGTDPVIASDTIVGGSEMDCPDNCTSLEHRLNSLFQNPGHFPLPGHVINGVVQEVKYCTAPMPQSQGSSTQVHGEIVTTILTRRQSFKAKVDPKVGAADVRKGERNSFQCTPFSPSENNQFLRLNSVQPYTLTFQIQQFPNITVQEIIDSLLSQLSSDLQSSLKGVRMVGNNCFLSFSRQADMDRVLAAGIKIKDKPVQLNDASIGTTVLSLSGVPHHIPDQAIDNVLTKYGCLVGQVERRVYKGIDIGERFVRLRAKLAIPRFISICGHPVKIRVLHDEEVNNLSISRRRSFRSQLNIRLKVPSTDDLEQSTESLDASLHDSQSTLPETRGSRIHLTPPIPPLPNEVPEKNLNLIPPSSVPASHGYSKSFDGTDVRTLPIKQEFGTSSESLGNRTDPSVQNIHHSLPNFVNSNVITTSADSRYFTYPSNSTTQAGESRFFQNSGVLDPTNVDQDQDTVDTRNTATGPTPMTNCSTNCFQFPVGPAANQGFARGNQNNQSGATGNQSSPSSIEKKTCSSDKDQDSEREKSKGEKGKETKKKKGKGKQGKSQGKQTDRKVVGVGLGECSQSSSSGQDSPSKSRRKLSVNFKRGNDGSSTSGAHSPVFRTASFDRHDRDGPLEMVGTCSEFERSNSETSSRFGSTNAPRKMSSTGREQQKGKVPWCGCWGNGCC